MKGTRIASLFLIGVLCSVINAGCKKDPHPDYTCDDGSCCGASGYQYKYITSIENAPADYAGHVFSFRNPINGVQVIPVCFMRWEKVDGLRQTYIPGDTNPPYRYRVWGEVYQNKTVIGINPGQRDYELRILKVETVP